jgi:glycosyltransferase involved in cell wall biosynthesis
MVIGLIASPFIAVSPTVHSRTQLFVAQLAESLGRRGHKVIVYANAASRISGEVCWIYEGGEDEIEDPKERRSLEVRHAAWATQDASKSCDIIHINSALVLPHSAITATPIVFTVPGAYSPEASELYACYSDVHYVFDSRLRSGQDRVALYSVISQGVDLAMYELREHKQGYLCSFGLITPRRGTHTAIAIAKKAGMPLKIAGHIDRASGTYFETQIAPCIDGKSIDYVGEVDQQAKAELLGNAAALLFPAEGDSACCLVMKEAMACGTAVLAFRGGAVEETVSDGVTGEICSSEEDMAVRARDVSKKLSSLQIRNFVEQHFSTAKMAEDYEKVYFEVYRSAVARGMKSRAATATLVSFRQKKHYGLLRSARKKILCIDDRIEHLVLEQAILQLHGYDVVTASNGAAGLALLKQDFIDLVILDYCMPEMTGQDVALEIRRMHLAVPIVLFSGNDAESLPEPLFVLTNGFVSKGAPPEVLLSLIKQLTSIARAA